MIADGARADGGGLHTAEGGEAQYCDVRVGSSKGGEVRGARHWNGAYGIREHQGGVGGMHLQVRQSGLPAGRAEPGKEGSPGGRVKGAEPTAPAWGQGGPYPVAGCRTLPRGEVGGAVIMEPHKTAIGVQGDAGHKVLGVRAEGGCDVGNPDNEVP